MKNSIKFFSFTILYLFCTIALSAQNQYKENIVQNSVDEYSSTKDLLPPTNFVANLFGGNDIKLDWKSPEGVGNWINWDEGLNYGSGIGLAYGGTFYIATRWLPEDLAEYEGMSVSKFSFFPIDDPNASFELRAWTGEDAANLIMTQSVPSSTLNEWNEVELNEPILIDGINELWLGYAVTHDPGVNPAGHDEGPAIPYKGDLISSNGESWICMSIEFGWNYNWNFSAFVSPTTGKTEIFKPMEKNAVTLQANPSFTNHSGNGPAVKFSPFFSKGFLGYNIYRDGVIIEENSGQNSYFDFNLAQNTYSYDVKAVYDEGLSDGAGPLEVIVYEGVDRELVILEIATGTWCQYCPGAAMGADDLVNNGQNVGVIEYHYNDDYTTDESAYRLQNYYGVLGYPQSYFDGIISYTGGSNTTSLYDEFLLRYESRIEIPSLYTIDAYYINTSENNFEVVINVEMVDEYPGSTDEIVVQVVLTESHIPESWQGGLEEVNFVCRDMIPDHIGTPINLTTGNSQEVTHEFIIPSDYESDNLELVVFLQNNNTHEILQGTMAQLATSIEDVTEIYETKIYPNPANNFMFVENAKDCEIIVMDLAGKIISHFQSDNNLYIKNISDLQDGIYLVKIIHLDHTIQCEKLIISN